MRLSYGVDKFYRDQCGDGDGRDVDALQLNEIDALYFDG